MPHALIARMSRLLAAAALVLALPAAALTPPCGAQLTQSVQLTSDMYCSNNYPALVVGADGVTIDLNGYEIVGPGCLGGFQLTPAIRSTGYDKVQVVGPGTIRMWTWDVQIWGGSDHLVTGISGQSCAGISLTDSSDAQIKYNALQAVGISSSTVLGSALRNAVYANRIGAPGTSGGVGLQGCSTFKNTISGNEINGFVQVDYGANGNLIDGNKIRAAATRDEAVLLGEAYRNKVSRNSIDAGTTIGVSIVPSAYPQYTCGGGAPGMNGDGNLVTDNSIVNAATGVRVGTLQPPSQTLGTDNRITSNRIADMTGRGLLFAPGSARNDGQGNSYVNVPIAVEDFGSGNLWP